MKKKYSKCCIISKGLVHCKVDSKKEEIIWIYGLLF
jgi:hypothetical protein